jgi:hypothetical protein
MEENSHDVLNTERIVNYCVLLIGMPILRVSWVRNDGVCYSKGQLLNWWTRTSASYVIDVMPGQIPGGGGRLHQSATCSARREAGLIFYEEVGLELRRKKVSNPRKHQGTS